MGEDRAKEASGEVMAEEAAGEDAIVQGEFEVGERSEAEEVKGAAADGTRTVRPGREEDGDEARRGRKWPEKRQAAAEAARLQAEAAAADEKQRRQAEADADAQARRKEAQDLLQRHEAARVEKLKVWHFEQSEDHDDATPEEQHKEFLSRIVTRLDLEQATPRPDAGEPSNAASTRQLEEQVDHVAAMLGDISTFAAPATINEQLDTLQTELGQLHHPPDNDRSTSASKHYKMPTFRIEKFDDYMHQDSVVNNLHKKISWEDLSHMATIHDIQVNNLHKKISWEDLMREWKKWFIVDDAPTLAINHLFTMTQGNTSTHDWLTEWQEIVATPDLDLSFPHLCREFYNRSCAALSLALGDHEQYTTFVEIIDKGREIIKSNRAAAHEKTTWQPTHVEKGKFGPRPQHVAAVQPDNIVEDPTTTLTSCEGDQGAAIQPRSNNNSSGKGKAKTASPAGNRKPVPWGEEVTPTVGYTVEKFSTRMFKFTVVDMSGQANYRQLWQCFYKDVDGLVFVVDAADRSKIATAKSILHSMLSHQELTGTSLLVLANKMDLIHAMPAQQVAQGLHLPGLGNRRWHIRPCSALTGDGMDSVLNWIISTPDMTWRKEVI
ncbi:hypothetical protein CBR_g6410 [Chara braunii]|uniref:ADP-ribosylation factor-like protein 6 n=1 Tax=Chara braunii TaxID=69332 RepID=A0A388KJZ1_CHABU|nr:hypothetical protein CBR_g6410 [Chara braunii]|eukprot:GBG70283.1 hypothetical protein CBR_g6410 [Chara braunii]